MGSLIETFHLDLRLLIAQIINFAIVFFVLYWFAFKPLAKIMSERAKKIEKGLEDAKKIEEKLAFTEARHNEEIVKAKKEALVILEKAGLQAEERKKEDIRRAKEEIGEIINQEKTKMQAEKAVVLKEIKKEIADLVALTLEKILDQKINEKEDREIIKRIIKETK